MNIAVLETFVAVMRRGGFAAVARDRGTDPSTVSRAVASLEKALGVRLFQRTTRRLTPTEAGVVYFERIEPLVEELARARLAARDVSGQPQGALRVTASVSFGERRIAPLLPAFREAFPALSIELVLSDGNLDLIAERIDLAVRLGPRTDSGMVGSKLFDTRYRVCASPEYLRRHGTVATPRDLAARSCLLFPFPGYRTRWIFRDATGRRREVPVQGRIVISNALALHRCARDGLGPALLADWLVDDDLASGNLVDLFPEFRVTATDFETAVWLLYPSRAYLPLKTRAFIDFLRQSFRSGPDRR